MSEYVLMQPLVYTSDSKYNLPAGSFIVPISEYYLPDHIKKLDALDLWGKYRLSFKDEYQFCYTRVGIIPIPQPLIRKIV